MIFSYFCHDLIVVLFNKVAGSIEDESSPTSALDILMADNKFQSPSVCLFLKIWPIVTKTAVTTIIQQ